MELSVGSGAIRKLGWGLVLALALYGLVTIGQQVWTMGRLWREVQALNPQEVATDLRFLRQARLENAQRLAQQQAQQQQQQLARPVAPPPVPTPVPPPQ